MRSTNRSLEGQAATTDDPSRRAFLRSAAWTAGALALGACGSDRSTGRNITGPLSASLNEHGDDDHEGDDDGSLNAVDHIIVVTMENRSFDHFLGWVHRADGRQAGLSYVDANGVRHPTHALAPDFQGCGFADPDHSFTGARVEYNGGKCDGWLRAGKNDVFSIGYYEQKDLEFLGRAANDWTVCDNYFAAILGPTFPNRFFMHAGQSDRISNTSTIATLPTIWDSLAAKKLDGRYYFSDLPFLGLWGTKYNSITHPIADFFAACQSGALPNVAYIDPVFSGEGAGTSIDDHPHADIRAGEAFLQKIYTAVTQSPAWSKTVLVITYDEWGGFYDHVPPTSAPTSAIDRAAGNIDGLRGFRVPTIVISPFAKRENVSHTLFDHTSIVAMIEQRWRLDPLTTRTQRANSLGDVLDMHEGRKTAPQYPVPFVPPAHACAVASAEWKERKWAPLAEVVRGMASAI
jgi:phospholipase C